MKYSQNKINILFIATYQNYFIKDHANFNRMYNNLIYFHNNKNHNVFVLQPEREKSKEILELKKDIKTYYFREIRFLNFNFSSFIDFNPFFISKIIKIIKIHNIDLIHIEFLYGINIINLITTIPISYNSYNVESIFADKVGKYYKKLPKILRYIYSKYIFLLEKSALNKSSNINVVSKNDKLIFSKLYKIPKSKLFVSHFGYRKEVYLHPINKQEARKRLGLDQSSFILIFHGSYYINYANQEAIKFIIKDLSPKFISKEILFLIAGKIPTLKTNEHVKLLGFLESLKDFIYSADVAIAPIFRGSGIKTKIIDYLSGSIPVITTSKGAEGLLLKNEIHGYIVQNSVKDMIDKINILRNDPEKIQKFKKNIHKLIDESYNWEKISLNLIERYKKIIILKSKQNKLL